MNIWLLAAVTFGMVLTTVAWAQEEVESAAWPAFKPMVYPGKTYTVGSQQGQVATIAQALTQLQPGDTLALTPGIYHESIKVPCDGVAVVATAPGVVLDGSVTLKASDFQAAADRPGIFVWPLPADAPVTKEGRTPWIWMGQQKLIASFTPLESQKDQMAFHVNEATGMLEVNFDGKSLPADATFVVPVHEFLVDARGRANVTVRGLSLTRSASYAVSARRGQALRVEFCDMEWVGDGIDAPSHSNITGNTIRFANGSAIHQNGHDTVVMQNLVVATRICWDGFQRWAGTIKHNSSSRNLYCQNWIMDQLNIGGKTMVGHREVIRTAMFASGLWPDINCYDNVYYNNAVARMGHAGAYIEFTSDRNTVQFNALQDCAMGITVRQGRQNLITRNWTFTSDYLGWGSVDTTEFCSYGVGFDRKTGEPVTQPEQHPVWGKQYLEGLCLWHAYDEHQDKSRDNAFIGNLVQVSGRAVSVPVAREKAANEDFNQNELGLVVVDKRKQYEPAPLPDAQAALTQAPKPSPFDNRFDGNFYDRPADDTDFAWLGDKVAGTFEEYRRQTGWDQASQAGRFTTAAIGLEPLWTIPAGALKDQPVAILYDPSLQASAAEDWRVPLFWQGSHIQRNYVVPTLPVTYWAPNRTTQDRLAARDGKGRCLNMKTALVYKGKPVTQSATWQTPVIPVRPGITMGLDFWLRSDLRAGEQGGTSVRMVFLDSCGFEIGQGVVIGKGVREELASGTFDWTNVGGQAKVPQNANWMRVVLTLPPSDGAVSFDGVRIGMVDPVPPSFDKRK